MTTKLAYRIQSVIDYDSLSFDPDEPESLPDAMFQYQILEEILHVLGTHITTRRNSPLRGSLPQQQHLHMLRTR